MLISALVACVTTHAQAQQDTLPELQAMLIEREHEWTDAMRTHNYESLNQILAQEFQLSFVAFSGALPREGWLANLKSMSFGPITMTDMQVNILSPASATVSMHMHLEDWKRADETVPPNYQLTDVWVLRDGRWQAKARISHPLDPGPRPGPPRGEDVDPEKTLLDLTNAYNAAWETLDVDTISAFHADDIRYYWRGDLACANQQEFKPLLEGILTDINAYSAVMVDPNVYVISPNAGIVSFQFDGQVDDHQGQTHEYDGAMTYVFEKRNGQWKLTLIHESAPVPEG
jgi:ketosteroid isomerase-like protein